MICLPKPLLIRTLSSANPGNNPNGHTSIVKTRDPLSGSATRQRTASHALPQTLFLEAAHATQLHIFQVAHLLSQKKTIITHFSAKSTQVPIPREITDLIAKFLTFSPRL